MRPRAQLWPRRRGPFSWGLRGGVSLGNGQREEFVASSLEPGNTGLSQPPQGTPVPPKETRRDDASAGMNGPLEGLARARPAFGRAFISRGVAAAWRLTCMSRLCTMVYSLNSVGNWNIVCMLGDALCEPKTVAQHVGLGKIQSTTSK